MRTLAILVVLALAGMIFLGPLALLADAPADPQVTADQAAAAAALAHAAEVKAPAEAKLLDAQADAFAADAAATVEERMTRLALNAALRSRMNDLRVFGMGILLGTAAAGLPTLLGLVLLRLLLGAGWRQRLFGSGASPAPATHGESGSGDLPGAGDAAENVQPGAPGAAVKHRHYEPQE